MSEKDQNDVEQPPPSSGWDPYDVWKTRVLGPRLEQKPDPQEMLPLTRPAPALRVVSSEGCTGAGARLASESAAGQPGGASKRRGDVPSGWWIFATYPRAIAAAAISVPLALWLGVSALERALLVGSVLAMLIVEWLKSAIMVAVETSNDHQVAVQAQDMGSAAGSMSVVLAMLLWVAIAWQRFGA